MSTPISQSESLKIISEMIEAAKSEIKGQHFYFIFWGWLAIGIHIAHYCLIHFTTFTHPEVVWLLAIIGGIVTAIKSKRDQNSQRITTHLDKVIGFVWMAYGITVMIVIAFGFKINFAIYPMITLLTAIPTFLTGAIIRYKPLLFGGILFWPFAILSFLMSPVNQILVGAVALVCGYLVPGYMMKKNS